MASSAIRLYLIIPNPATVAVVSVLALSLLPIGCEFKSSIRMAFFHTLQTSISIIKKKNYILKTHYSHKLQRLEKKPQEKWDWYQEKRIKSLISLYGLNK